jgi:predicted HTH transcriptional regulator
MILQLIRQGEGEMLDFKQKITSALKIAKTLSAFANTKGGKILVGVKDNGVVSGINTYEEKHMLEGAAHICCKPGIELTFTEEILNGKSILVAEVPESREKPHYARDEAGKWWAYIRVKDQTLLASKVMLDVMRSDSKGVAARIEFGSVEKKLLEFLESNPRITQKEFCKLAGISGWRANKTLVNLVRMGVVKVLSNEKADYFTV